MKKAELTGILRTTEEIRDWARREAKHLLRSELVRAARERHKIRASRERDERIAAKEPRLALVRSRPVDSRDLVRLWRKRSDFDPRT